MELVTVDFEIFGDVQGVFFRKYAQKEAHKLGIKGWCLNTSQGTVTGVLEGYINNVNVMKQWLENIGSPICKIDRADFKNERKIQDFSYPSFEIRRIHR